MQKRIVLAEVEKLFRMEQIEGCKHKIWSFLPQLPDIFIVKM